MKESTILYVPLGRKTFDLEAAEIQRVKSSQLLKDLSSVPVVEPDGIITSPVELNSFLDSIDTANVTTTIYQSVTFADAEAVDALMKKVAAPVIVWSVREPSVGGRLRLNSLTGGNSTSHHLYCANHPYSFLFGNPDEKQVKSKLKEKLVNPSTKEVEEESAFDPNDSSVSKNSSQRVTEIIQQLQQMKIGVIGDHPPGFFFAGTNTENLQQQFGVSIKYFDLNKALEDCVKLPEKEWEGAIERAKQQVIGLNKNDETVKRFAQFTTYVQKQIDKEELIAIAVRCYPEFFNNLGAAACSTLSQFTEDGIVSACESDIHGSISMYILQQLSGGKAPYLGDMVHVNEASNSVVFWHCGVGAYSLAHSKTGARPGVHPNRKLGFTMEFGLKPGRVTIFRVSYTPSGYRLLVMTGNALDVPQRFNGTSVEVELETNVSETVDSLMKDGFEPHYALIYDDVADELMELGRQLGLQTIVYKEGSKETVV